MNRKEFVSHCTIGCLVMLTPAAIISCVGTKYMTAPIEGNDMVVPLSTFQIIKDNSTSYRKYVVVENESLQFPICVYRLSAEKYQALWMKCTHQGTELHVFGDRLQCPAHGSEFTTSGSVQNGPAAEPLRAFQIALTDTHLKISLK